MFWDITKREVDKARQRAVGMLRSIRSKNCRGRELLDELATVLPNLYSFNKESDLDFLSTITLLHKYWSKLTTRIDKDDTNPRSEFIRILNRMITLYRETNLPVAYGVLVVLWHIESSYLNDEESRLVHCITSIHIDGAASRINYREGHRGASASLAK
jgi:hypothetical protein